jgi:hypothetical protein
MYRVVLARIPWVVDNTILTFSVLFALIALAIGSGLVGG